MRRSPRRFQPVFVTEPTVEDTISILRGLKEKYELHHGVRISDAALVAAATLSNRYITDRFLPDKAIDLVDEAASRLRMQVDSKPEELDELERRIMQLKIEREALKKERTRPRRTACAKLEKEIADLEEQASRAHRPWQAEKGSSLTRKDQGAARRARIELEQAQRTRRSREGRRTRLRRDSRAREEAQEDRGPRTKAARWRRRR